MGTRRKMHQSLASPGIHLPYPPRSLFCPGSSIWTPHLLSTTSLGCQTKSSSPKTFAHCCPVPHVQINVPSCMDQLFALHVTMNDSEKITTSMHNNFHAWTFLMFKLKSLRAWTNYLHCMSPWMIQKRLQLPCITTSMHELWHVMGMHAIGCHASCHNSLHEPSVTCPHQLHFELDPAIGSSFQRLEYLPGNGAHAETIHVSWQFTFTCVSGASIHYFLRCFRANVSELMPAQSDHRSKTMGSCRHSVIMTSWTEAWLE